MADVVYEGWTSHRCSDEVPQEKVVAVKSWKRSPLVGYSDKETADVSSVRYGQPDLPAVTVMGGVRGAVDLHRSVVPVVGFERHMLTGSGFSGPHWAQLRDGRPLASFVDPVSGLTFEAHTPHGSPQRWRGYLDGAESRYRSHGVLRALDRRRLEDGRSTSLFFVAVDEDDRVVAGIRCHGPVESPPEAYVLGELKDDPGLAVVRDILIEHAPAGVVELKGAWVESNFPRPGLSNALARCFMHAMNWFGAQFAICSCAASIAPRWESGGGRAVAGLKPIGYPDDRYQTLFLWWDRERVEELSDPEQWSAMMVENDQLMAPRRSRAAGPARRGEADGVASWRPEILDVRLTVDRARLGEIFDDPRVELLDHWAEQLAGLLKVGGVPPQDEAPRWVYYPWRNCVVKLLGPVAFRRLRLDRNRNKITRAEQDRLEHLRVGVVGLSVGHSIAHVLALEGICGELRLADFDVIELSNLNRIPTTVLDLGLNKAVSVSRRIAELDPYLDVSVLADGVTASNIDGFVEGLDVVIEECDSLDLKLLVREAARRRAIPVIMETSDRGLLDVERFDLEPDRPLFHGLLGDVVASDLVGLSTHDKVPYVLRLLEPAELSSRMAASMAEIDETLATWPQLGGDVSLGAATVATAIRRLGRGDYLPSGRVRIDLEWAIDRLVQPDPPDSRVTIPAEGAPPPQDPLLAVAHAAGLAPSGGNSQPWSLRLEQHRLRLCLNRELTSTMDIRFRGSYVAIGAALLNARIAAAAKGVGGPVEYFPEGENSDLVAVLNFGTGSDAELAAQYGDLLQRSTNRRAGVPSELGAGVANELHRAVASEGARLSLLTSEDDLESYAELLGESDRLRYLSPILHAEMMGELRWPGQDPLDSGIDVRTLELDDSDLSKLSVARRSDVMADLAAWDGGRALGQITRERIRSSSALAVVTLADDRARTYVAGGEAVQRLWLAAERAGLAVQPVSPLSVFALDTSDFEALVPAAYVPRLQALSARLRTLAGVAQGEGLALVLRLSHAGPPSARSLRFPLQSSLLDDADRPM